jgi:hypothetical protein
VHNTCNSGRDREAHTTTVDMLSETEKERPEGERDHIAPLRPATNAPVRPAPSRYVHVKAMQACSATSAWSGILEWAVHLGARAMQPCLHCTRNPSTLHLHSPHVHPPDHCGLNPNPLESRHAHTKTCPNCMFTGHTQQVVASGSRDPPFQHKAPMTRSCSCSTPLVALPS